MTVGPSAPAIPTWPSIPRPTSGPRSIRIKQGLAKSFYMMKSVSQADAGGGRFAHKIVTAPGVLGRLAGLSPGQLKDVNLVVYHNWDTTRRFLAAVDLDSQSLTAQGSKWQPWNPWRADGLFHLENFRAALDAAGEWFLDRDGTLLYKPLPGQDPDHVSAFAPAGSARPLPGRARIWAIHRKHPIPGPDVPAWRMADPRGRRGSLPGGHSVDAAIMADGARISPSRTARYPTWADTEFGSVAVVAASIWITT